MAGTAVIFVHGLFSSSKAWDRFDRLLRADIEIVERFDLNYFQYDSPVLNLVPWRRIPDLTMVARRLRTDLRAHFSRNVRVILVSHSQGGLVIQRGLAQMISEGLQDELRRISGVGMFAGPNTGSELALSVRRRLRMWHHPPETA